MGVIKDPWGRLPEDNAITLECNQSKSGNQGSGDAQSPEAQDFSLLLDK